jgi:hypothetical protein
MASSASAALAQASDARQSANKYRIWRIPFLVPMAAERRRNATVMSSLSTGPRAPKLCSISMSKGFILDCS